MEKKRREVTIHPRKYPLNGLIWKVMTDDNNSNYCEEVENQYCCEVIPLTIVTMMKGRLKIC